MKNFYYLVLAGILVFMSIELFSQSDCQNAVTIDGIPYSSTGLTTVNEGNYYNSSHACNSNALNNEEFVLTFTPTDDINVNIELNNTNLIMDGLMSIAQIGLFVIKECPDSPDSECIASNTSQDENPALYNVSLSANETYYIIISSTDATIFTEGEPETNVDFDINITKYMDTDIEAISFINLNSGCGLTDNEEISVQIKNNGFITASNFEIGINLNGNTIATETFSEPIEFQEIKEYTFTTLFDLSQFGDYTIEFYTNITEDEEPNNNNISTIITHTPTHSNYPFLENFEGGEAYWTSLGTNNSWEYGIPENSNIDAANSIENCWITNLDGNANTNENSSLISPCFDFSSLLLPKLEFYVWRAFGLIGNSADIQISKDAGQTWEETLVSWNSSSSGWEKVSIELPNYIGEQNIKFKFNFNSVLTPGNGIAIDDFQITEGVFLDAGPTSINVASGCGLTDNENVTIEIKNFGYDEISNFPLAISVDQGTSISEIFSASISPGETSEFTFSQTFDFSQYQEYEIQVYTNLSNDVNTSNDTLTVSFLNTPVYEQYPLTLDFEDGQANWTTSGSNTSWEMGLPSESANINFAFSGENIWATNLDGNANTNENSYLTSPCFDLTNLTLPALDFYIWRAFGLAGNSVNIQISKDGGQTWEETLFSWSNSTDEWEHVYLELPNYVNENNVRFRFNFSSSINPGNGIAFDNFSLINGKLNDIGINSFINLNSACGLSSQEEISVEIENFGFLAINNIDISISINGGTSISEIHSVTIDSGEIYELTFSETFDLSNYGEFFIEVVVHQNNDENLDNNTISKTIIHTPVHASFPHIEEFENGEAFWSVSGSNASWELGIPDENSGITHAASGENCWVTNLDGNANASENSYLISPCYNVSSLTIPSIEFKNWRTFGLLGNSSNIQYSVDGGNNWSNAFISWTNSTNQWESIYFELPELNGETNVRFRINYNSGLTAGNGIGIDDFSVREAKLADLGIRTIIHPSSSCGLTDTETVSVHIENYGAVEQTNIPVNFSTDNGETWLDEPEIYTGILQPGEFASFTFTAKADLLENGMYNFIARTEYPNDDNLDNDALVKIIHSIPIITEYEYSESFENGQAGWRKSGTNSSLELAIPEGEVITEASDGEYAWVTNYNGSPNTNEVSYLESPCLDFSNLSNPKFEAMIQHQIGTLGNFYVEYSIDNFTWTKLESHAISENWYGGILSANWTGNSSGWKNVATLVPQLANQSDVKLRFVYNAGAISLGSVEGIAIDLIRISNCDNPPIADFDYEIDGLTVNFLNNSQYADTYYWEFNNATFFPATSEEENPSFTFGSAGTYTIELSVTGECGTDYISKEVNVGTSNLNKTYSENIYIYPNPASTEIYIENVNNQNSDITIMNISGQTIYEVKSSNSQIKIPINELANGTYFIKITNKLITKTFTFIKE